MNLRSFRTHDLHCINPRNSSQFCKHACCDLSAVPGQILFAVQCTVVLFLQVIMYATVVHYLVFVSLGSYSCLQFMATELQEPREVRPQVPQVRGVHGLSSFRPEVASSAQFMLLF